MLVLAAAAVVQVAAADELVQIIEEQLDALGYDTGAVDGEATVKTAVAISQFQAENGMPVTGEPSPQLAGILSAKVGGSNDVAKLQSASPAGVAAVAVEACLDRKREEKEKLKADKEKRFGKNSKIAQNSSLELTDRDIAECNNPATATAAGAGAAAATTASTDGSSGSVVPVLDRSTRTESFAKALLHIEAIRSRFDIAPEPAPGSGKRTQSAAREPFRRFELGAGWFALVGRSNAENDDLTFRHSAPGDVWLHARHSAGAHVVLRWAGPGNPPARDLEEAGALAALHSKARTSSSVPVDWTLRKYVRKPRQAAPGAVVPDRVKTIFVRPDPELRERLADPV